MKKLLFIVAAVITFVNVSISGEEVKSKKDLTFKKKPRTICIYQDGKIGRKKHNCTGLGLGCLIFEIESVNRGAIPPKGKIYSEVTMLNTTTFNYVFTPESDETDLDFLVESESSEMFQKIARDLGFNSVQLVEGLYPVVKMRDGKLSVNIKAISK